MVGMGSIDVVFILKLLCMRWQPEAYFWVYKSEELLARGNIAYVERVSVLALQTTTIRKR